jgi:hypothetical protein
MEAKSVVPAYQVLVSELISIGCSISVLVDGEYSPSRSKNRTAILDAIKLAPNAQLIVRNDQGKKIGWAEVSHEIQDCDSTIIDYTVGLKAYSPLLANE